MSSDAPATAQTPLLPRPSTSTLLTYDEVVKLDPWRDDNHYILTGYRRTLNSYWLCFKSIFSVHNETVNIVSRSLARSMKLAHLPLLPQWTHLVGAAVAVISLVYAVSYLSAEASQATGRRGWMAPFAGIPYPFPSADHPSVQWIDAAGFGVFFLSAATCLGEWRPFHRRSRARLTVTGQASRLPFMPSRAIR